MSSIAERLANLRQRLTSACAAAERDPATVRLIAVSKTHGPEAIRAAQAAGQVAFGENYAQELRDKAARLDEVEWHFIGRIQTNKAKMIAPRAARIHALTEVRHAEALAAKRPEGRELQVLVSVHTGEEASKAGVPPDQVLARCRDIDAVPGVQVVGLMTLPPFYEDPDEVAPHFEQVAELAHRGRASGLALTELSMGMSHDFEVAIRYGATWIRVGTAIFGRRGQGPWRPA